MLAVGLWATISRCLWLLDGAESAEDCRYFRFVGVNCFHLGCNGIMKREYQFPLSIRIDSIFRFERFVLWQSEPVQILIFSHSNLSFGVSKIFAIVKNKIIPKHKTNNNFPFLCFILFHLDGKCLQFLNTDGCRAHSLRFTCYDFYAMYFHRHQAVSIEVPWIRRVDKRIHKYCSESTQ